MSMLATILAAASLVPAAAGVDTWQADCATAGNWSPVRMPQAGISAQIPCSAAELANYKGLFPKADGVAGCVTGAGTFNITYFANAPEGFFDSFAAPVKGQTVEKFSIEGHAGFRITGNADAAFQNSQAIKIDEHRMILIGTSALSDKTAGSARLAACFLSSLRFLKS